MELIRQTCNGLSKKNTIIIEGTIPDGPDLIIIEKKLDTNKTSMTRFATYEHDYDVSFMSYHKKLEI